jgi:hypothetical protein
MPVTYEATARLTFTTGYACARCGFTGRGVVQGRGFARGRTANEQLSEAAQAAALQSAEMRCELARCPRCGKRGWGAFLQTWGKNAFACAAVAALVAVGGWMRFDKTDWVWIGLGLAGVLQVVLAIVFAFDLLAATRVRFLADDADEKPPAQTAYRSPPEL